jgi:K+-transporting ATPase ATPase C chain
MSMQLPIPNATDGSTTSIGNHGLLRGACVLGLITLLGFGLLYPLLGVGLAQALFAHTANGSLLERDGKIIGSALVAQPFADPRYFQPRPSAAGYDPMAMAGSNQALSDPALRQRIADTRNAVARRDGVAASAVPADLLTQSGSGIDADISPQAAAIQVARVAHARGLRPATVQALLAQHLQRPQFGVLGQPRVNVLVLNLALDARTARTH